MNINLQISIDLNITEKQVNSVANLLDEGATVPFISRYRKEVTGTLDEVAVLNIKELLQKYRDLEKRKESILKSLEENGFLTKELEDKVLKANNITLLEDIYMPYKPKRKTRGVKAKDAGLEPLAHDILMGRVLNPKNYISGEFTNENDVLGGAKDIIAELINEDLRVRTKLRDKFIDQSIVSCKAVKTKIDSEEAIKLKDYFDYSEKLSKVPSHRILAILRGVSKGFLRMKIDIEDRDAISIISPYYSKGLNKSLIDEAISDSYKRLLSPSLETEMKNKFKLLADEKAVEIFTENLRELLLQSPLGEKSVLAIDPGLRTGSKVTCLNKQGALLEHCVIKPLPPHNNREASGDKIKSLCKKYSIEAISVGNGTGGREMEEFLSSLNLTIPTIMTNESGASIYSASDCAREEFPDLDLTVRGSVSIGRRLIDPLSELVKIDPKSIGVGQYQHDVDQKLLKESLENTVISCVNSVGVELNTASKELLSYVAGLNKKIASNIITYRNSNGSFKSRKELLKVKGLGDKAYEQAAGFIRVRNSNNSLDRSGVHPERYLLVEKMASDLDVSIDNLIENKELRSKIDRKKYISGDVGLPTIEDILKELEKPGRDPRKEFEFFQFDSSIKHIEDVMPNQVVPGIVTNVTAFGAFVDIGVHQDGLVHISQLSNNFVSDPSVIVKTGQKVMVKVMDVDKGRKRISLTMKL